MSIKLIAASFVVIWLLLLGIEFSEDLGFAKYNDPYMDKSVEATLASMGKAIPISDHAAQWTPSHRVSVLPAVFGSLRVPSVSHKWFRRETGFPKEDIPTYKLHLVFLI